MLTVIWMLDRFDTVLIDCAPTLGVLTVNGLTAADEVLVPLQCEALSHRGVAQLLDTIAEHESLVKYIDIPLQHASGNVLKRMKRGSNGDFFLKLLERMRKTIPGVAIRTSMIVGFPGETEQDFEELQQFVEAAQFTRLGVFEYSDEDTSKSFALDGKVDQKTIARRKRSIMAQQKKISKAHNKAPDPNAAISPTVFLDKSNLNPIHAPISKDPAQIRPR